MNGRSRIARTNRWSGPPDRCIRTTERIARNPARADRRARGSRSGRHGTAADRTPARRTRPWGGAERPRWTRRAAADAWRPLRHPRRRRCTRDLAPAGARPGGLAAGTIPTAWLTVSLRPGQQRHHKQRGNERCPPNALFHVPQAGRSMSFFLIQGTHRNTPFSPAAALAANLFSPPGLPPVFNASNSISSNDAINWRFTF